jgi:hypothetical protein
MAHSYLKGQAIICTVVFRDGETEAYVDPTVVTFRELDPSNNVVNHVFGVDVNVIQDSTGHYHYVLTLDEAGEWHYRWDCSGTYVGAAEAVVSVCAAAHVTW